ncbi:MAG: hypothetical protein ABEJ72_00975, partial [Candidatus Aenigmatarchaeota archaeon]
SINDGLKSLDKRNELRENLSPAGVKEDLEPYIPREYTADIRIVKETDTSGNISAPGEVYLDQTGDYSELLLWVESASNMGITFDGQSIVSDIDSARYMRQRVDGTGYLNATGSGTVYYRLVSYRSEGTLEEKPEVYAANYILSENGSKEIQVRVWQE